MIEGSGSGAGSIPLTDGSGSATLLKGALCLAAGLEDQGLYRVVGVASKVTKLLNMGLDRRKFDKINLGMCTGNWFAPC